MKRNKHIMKMDRNLEKIEIDITYLQNTLLDKTEGALKASLEDGFESGTSDWPPSVRKGKGPSDPTGNLVTNPQFQALREQRRAAERLVEQASKQVEEAQKQLGYAIEGLCKSLQLVNPPRLAVEGIDYE